MSQRGMVQKVERPRTDLIPPKGAVEIGRTHDNKHTLYQLPRRMNRPVPYIEAEVSDQCGLDERGEAKHTWKNDKVNNPVCTVCSTMGKRLYTTHSQTGENIVARRKPHVVPEVRTFYLEDGRNCNVAIVDYKRPTDEDIAREQQDKDKAEMGGGKLGEAFVNAGIKPGEVEGVLRRLRAEPEVPVAPRGAIPPEPQPETVLTTTSSFEDQAAEFKVAHVPEPPVVEPPKEYPIADEKGPWWTLSDGSRLRGVDAAKKAEAALQAQRDEAHKEAAESAEASF